MNNPIKAIVIHYMRWDKTNGVSYWYHTITNTKSGQSVSLMSPSDGNLMSSLSCIEDLGDYGVIFQAPRVEVKASQYKRDTKELSHYDCCGSDVPTILSDLFADH